MIDGINQANYTNADIETLIRAKLQRARRQTDPSIRKRANRNVFKFILELARSIGEGRARQMLESAGGGTLEGLLFSETLIAASKESELKPEAKDASRESEDYLVAFTHKLLAHADRKSVNAFARKLQEDKYPV